MASLRTYLRLSLTLEQAKYAQQTYDALDPATREPDTLRPEWITRILGAETEDDEGPYFCFAADVRGVCIVGGDDWVNVDQMAAFLHHLLVVLRLDPIGFTWAYASTPNRLRFAACPYSGGACFITQAGPRFFTAEAWLAQQRLAEDARH